MREKYTRALRIIEAPDHQKDLLVGKYLIMHGSYENSKTEKSASRWTSDDIYRARKYDETLDSIDHMQEYRELLNKHDIKTEILVVCEHVTAFSQGESPDFDGDDVWFYFTGISSDDGHQVFLSLISSDHFDYLKKNVRLNIVDTFKVGDDIMIWRNTFDKAWKFRSVPDTELSDKVNACAKEYGITNVTLGRMYQ